MHINLESIWKMLVATAKEWNAADPFRHGATISYYAIFSIPGLLMMVIWISGAVFGQEAVQGQISSQISGMMGSEAATGIEDLLKNANQNDDNWIMKTIGVLTLIFGATTLFFQLQKSLNSVWEVEAAPDNGIVKLLKDRASSLSLIVVIAFLLLITLVLSAVLAVVSDWLTSTFGEYFIYLAQLLNFAITLGIVTLLFAVMYKVLPDVEIGWRSVWVGAFVTALLFDIGKTLLGIYFEYADPASSFGAAGTVILVMLWVNYTCLILFFGAQFTQVYARKYGLKIEPSSHAKWSDSYILKQERRKEKDAEKTEK